MVRRVASHPPRLSIRCRVLPALAPDLNSPLRGSEGRPVLLVFLPTYLKKVRPQSMPDRIHRFGRILQPVVRIKQVLSNALVLFQYLLQWTAHRWGGMLRKCMSVFDTNKNTVHNG